MPIVPAAPAVRLPAPAGSAAVLVDPARHFVYVARPAEGAVLIVDTVQNVLRGRVALPGARALALEPLSGTLLVGTADGQLVDLDPVGRRVLRSVELGSSIDHIAYDAALGHVYVTAADSPTLWVVDVRRFALLARIALPAASPAGVAVDPLTHDAYVDLAGRGAVAKIDPAGQVLGEQFATPDVAEARALLFDPPRGEVLAVGDGSLDVLDRAGTDLGRAALPAGTADCVLAEAPQFLACAAAGTVSLVGLGLAGAVQPLGELSLPGAQPVLAFDPGNWHVWAVWTGPDGADRMQPLALSAAP